MATDLISQGMEVLIWSIPLILIGVIVMVFLKMRKFPLEFIIIEKRGENLIVTNDRGGRYQDKYTGLNGYTLLKAKEKVPVVNYEWIMHTNRIPTTILERLNKILAPVKGTVFLYRYGSKQYKPLNVKEKKDGKTQVVESVNENGEPIFQEIYQQFDPRGAIEGLSFEVMDWDDFNFMVQEFKSSYERRRKEKDWLKQIIIPAMAIGGAVIIGIVIVKYAFDAAALAQSNCPGVVEPNETITPDAANPNIPFISDVLPI